MNYPEKHYEIVQNLLNGKFILQGQEVYDILVPNYDFYKIFFKKSFKYDLVKTSEVIYLASDNTSEKFSRNLMLILAILVDNINLQGKDLYEELYKNYKIQDIEVIIKNSSYKSVCRNISIESLIKNDCQKRNIISYNNEIFDVFLIFFYLIFNSLLT
ncbi:MAG TPA: hypothetical protein EYP87_07320 [Flavobacteriaceae bacterium]|nr:hypothetical protein [Flavobacteriaceae bacterium]